MENTKKSVLNAAVIGLKLLLICAIVAAVVAGVYTLTEEKYNENMKEQKRIAIESIFYEGIEVIELTESGSDTPVYRVEKDGLTVGYCVEVTTKGYGGDIQLMVGYEADQIIRGISVVSHSETPGLGDKITGDDYRNQYVGKSGSLTLGSAEDQIDAISGATYSSKYVLQGVNDATAALNDVLGKEAGAQ